MDIRQILEENDFSRVIEYPIATGKKLSRQECESIVYATIGQTTPPNAVRFIVHTADGHWFLVFYNNNEFIYEKLSVAT